MSERTKIERLPESAVEWHNETQLDAAMRDRITNDLVDVDVAIRERICRTINQLADAVRQLNADAGGDALNDDVDAIEQRMRGVVKEIVDAQLAHALHGFETRVAGMIKTAIAELRDEHAKSARRGQR